MISIIIEGFLS